MKRAMMICRDVARKRPARRRPVLGAAFCAAFAGMLLPAAAEAAAAPSILPLRPVSVGYDLTSSQTGELALTMRADPADQLMRIDQAGNSDYLLLDFAHDTVRLVSPGKGMIFAVAPAGLAAITLAPDHLRLQRAGERVLLGLPCRVWTGAGEGGKGEACITRDGVILQGDAGGTPPGTPPGGAADHGRLVATSVSFAPIPTDLFAVPAGLQQVDLPPALFRAMVPGLAGLGAP
ncbi:hypothetical protein [Acidisoma sp. C75]